MEKSAKPKSWKTALRRLFKDSDEEGFNEALDQLPAEMKDEDAEQAAETDPVAERLEKLEQELATIKEQVALLQPKQEGDAEEEGQSEDEKEASDDEAASVFADAETLCPDMKRPQGDSASGKYSVELLERVKRNAIKASGITAFGDSATLDGAALDMAFRGALEVVKARHNPIATASKAVGDSAPSRYSNAELNSIFAKYWGLK